MEHFSSLLETALWVGLIVWLVLKFGKSLSNLLDALQKRVEGGGSVKAGPFELGESLKPQDLKGQKEKVEEEIQEIINHNGSTRTKSAKSQLTFSQYFEAEDLALRAVQAEFGEKINRQVTGGFDKGFDGVFAKEGTLHIIEVKSLRLLRKGIIRKSIEQITSAVSSYGWKNIKILLVLVTDSEKSQVLKYAEREIEGTNYQIELRIYSMDELRDTFLV